MADHDELLRRIDAIERRMDRIVDDHPTEAVLSARLGVIQSEISALRADVGRLETRADGLSGRMDAWREAWRSEAQATRNRVVAGVVSVAVVVVAAILLRGLQIG